MEDHFKEIEVAVSKLNYDDISNEKLNDTKG